MHCPHLPSRRSHFFRPEPSISVRSARIAEGASALASFQVSGQPADQAVEEQAGAGLCRSPQLRGRPGPDSADDHGDRFAAGCSLRAREVAKRLGPASASDPDGRAAGAADGLSAARAPKRLISTREMPNAGVGRGPI